MGVRIQSECSPTKDVNVKFCNFCCHLPCFSAYLEVINFFALFKFLLSVNVSDISLFMEIVFTENIFFSVCQQYCIGRIFEVPC